jgi:single-strand DNA-binding protein
VEKFLTKGSEVAVAGKLTHRAYDDKDGKKRYFTEVVMTEMVMLRGKSSPED